MSTVNPQRQDINRTTDYPSTAIPTAAVPTVQQDEQLRPTESRRLALGPSPSGASSLIRGIRVSWTWHALRKVPGSREKESQTTQHLPLLLSQEE